MYVTSMRGDPWDALSAAQAMSHPANGCKAANRSAIRTVRFFAQNDSPGGGRVADGAISAPERRPALRQKAASYDGRLDDDMLRRLIQAVVARPGRIRLTREDETGRRLVDEHTGLGARIMQHEADHLDGML